MFNLPVLFSYRYDSRPPAIERKNLCSCSDFVISAFYKFLHLVYECASIQRLNLTPHIRDLNIHSYWLHIKCCTNCASINYNHPHSYLAVRYLIPDLPIQISNILTFPVICYCSWNTQHIAHIRRCDISYLLSTIIQTCDLLLPDHNIDRFEGVVFIKITCSYNLNLVKVKVKVTP
jgi:hypothetical protein